jgi:hypothetical protein
MRAARIRLDGCVAAGPCCAAAGSRLESKG